MNANKKFLKEIWSGTPVNTWMIKKKKKKQSNLITYVEKVSVVLIGDQASHSIP